MTEKNGFKKGVLVGALSVIFIGLIIVVAYVVYSLVGDENSASRKLKMIDTLLESRYLYYDEIEESALEDGMLTGYIEALQEPYTAYYNEEETESLFASAEGVFGGIGVGIMQNPETMEVVFVEIYEGTPGDKAGFLQGDIVYKIDGEDVSGLDMDAVVSKIRGEVGTTVEITVLRGESKEEYTAQVTRELVESKVVSYEMKEDNIGYVKVTQFEKVALEQFEEALKTLQEKNMTSLIVDLRNNPGGDLETVCDMADLILPKGTIVSTKDRNGDGDTYESDEEHQLNLPMVVLVNENSASASEVFSGAMKDYGVATLVGTTTFGKGIVQEIYKLEDGSSLKLTSSEYFTPNGYNIHGIGIEPDVVVEAEYDDENPEYDNQLEKAIEILKNGM